MIPAFKIAANGMDITAKIADRLISLDIDDKAGFESDTVRIVLDDRDYAFDIPGTGAELEAWLGYEGSLRRFGRYTVDEIEFSGPPATMTIPAKAANMRIALKVQKTRAWPSTTLGAIVNKIASEHDLTTAISDSLASITFGQVDQTDESDLHLITRLAKTYDATAKLAEDRLVVVPRGEGRTVSGKDAPVISIDGPGAVTSWRMSAAERGKYAGVRAYYHSLGAAERVPVYAGDETGTVFTIRHPYASAEQAQSAAQGKLDALSRGSATLTMTMPGLPPLAAGSILSVSGFRKGVDGLWEITHARHSFSKRGYSSEVEAETPKGVAPPMLRE